MTSDASFQRICHLPNPFADDVVPAFDECSSRPGSVDLHAAILGRCVRAVNDLVSCDEGKNSPLAGSLARTLMIGAPRAGYGKTHLVRRLLEDVDGVASVLPLTFVVDEEVSWRNLLRRALRHFETHSVNGESLWQKTGRRLYAEVFLSAEQSGDLGEETPPVDPLVLRRDCSTVLAPGIGDTGGSQLRDWILENSHHLTELAADDIGSRWQIEPQALPIWMAAFRRSALETVANDERAAILRSLLPEAADADAEIQAKARLGELLRMASVCRPLILVIDHLDGFFGHSEVALPLANIIAALRSMVRRAVLLLCFNRDLWESVFDGALPSALTDRLNGEPAALGSISQDQARDLVALRLASAGVEDSDATIFFDHLVERENWEQAEPSGLYPRAVLRRASALWEHLFEAGPAPEMPESSKPPMPESESSKPKSITVAQAVAASRMAEPRHPTEPVLPPISAAPSSAEPSRVAANPQAAPTRFRPAPKHSVGQERSTDGSPMKDLQSIVSEIRAGGAWAVSEGPSPDDLKMVSKARQTIAASASVSESHGPTMNGSSDVRAQNSGPKIEAPTSGAGDKSPSVADISPHEAELRQRVAAFRNRSTNGSLNWLPVKVERLVSAVGERFPAVAQSCPQIGGQSALQWTVRGKVVLMGFAPSSDDGYWKKLAARSSVAEGDSGKVVAFISDGDPAPEPGSNASSTAVGIDVITLKDDDLALLYAGDDMIRKSTNDELEERVRFVARRMDPFWRRVTRPLSAE